MGRPRKTTPQIRVGFTLPQDLVNKVDSHLKSDVENRVPHGDKSKFFEMLTREFFQRLEGSFVEIETSLEKADAAD
jgi:hypothetical protein